jgi:hypothetical protein
MKNNYPKHVSDPVRIKIASELMQKELKKLFPSIKSNSQWEKVQKDIKNWFKGKNSELASVHDFWNGFEGITQGFKLKRINYYLTAENASFKKQEINIEKIILPWAENILPKEYFKGENITGKEIIEKLKNNKLLFNEIKKNSDYHSKWPVFRDNYPIIVLEEKQIFRTLDGNRRVIKAIVDGKKTIDAWLITIDGDILKNYWIGTPFLRNICAEGEIAKSEGDTKIYHACRELIKKLLQKSNSAKMNFDKRVKSKFPSFSDL